MILSDLSVRRPVFATVLSLLLLILGLMAALRLPIREYPDVSPPIVTVDTFYRGASANVIETRVTQLLEDSVAGIEGLAKLTSSSRDENSRVTLEFALERDIDAAANDVRERISRIASRLPEEADPPQISKVDSGGDAILFINVSSPARTSLELTDYADRHLVDRFSAVPGVAMVRIGGARRYAMRIWLERSALAARQLTVADIEDALRRENVELPAGRIESHEREFTLRTDTSLRTEDDFRRLAIGRGPDGHVVRLGEVARVALAAEDERSFERANGQPRVSLGILPQSQANVLEVARLVKAEVGRVRAGLPRDVKLEVNVDFSVFIVESMKSVARALAETLAIVLVVIYLFLGTVRATLVPAVTIPVSLLAAALVMAFLGYSINTLTLLGAVLAIGLVVDDSIVVLENIVRRIERGEPALLASITGSREIGFAVIATTLVLCAVFLPVSYMQGNVGRLFGEFGVAVAAAVAFSALIALTLTPMMASKLFAGGLHRGRVARMVDGLFRRAAASYEGLVRRTLTGRRPLLVIGAAVAFTAAMILLLVAGRPFSWLRLPVMFAPIEDRAILPVMVTAPEGSSLAYLDRHMRELEGVLMEEVDRGNVRFVNSRSGGFGRRGDVSTGVIFLPLTAWSERDEKASVIAERLRKRVAELPGLRISVIQPVGLGVRGGGKPLQVVLGGSDYGELAAWRDKVMARVQRENPRIVALESDYFERRPQAAVRIDRDRAADLGVSLATVGRTLESLLGSRIVTTFVQGGEEYNVVVQGRDDERASFDDLGGYYVRSVTTGALVPLSALVHIEEMAGPTELKRFDRLRSITLTANLAPGYSLGEALDYIERVIHEEVPGGVTINYDGESRELKQAGGRLWLTFGFALLIVYLVLAAQFESFIHPLVILATVPLALSGALVGLWLFRSSINVFSQIGAIMLIGIACKNGILIVEFANQLRDRGVEFREAVVQAATIRLRPVLMTSLCTACGAVPLMLATGAGAESRQSIGSAVFFGTVFSLALTLLVVPALYALVARRTQSPHHVSRLIERLAGAVSTGPGASNTLNIKD